MSFQVLIPARYGSSRFPGKPLIDLAGKSMIQRVYEQASASGADSVYVATDDERIAGAVTDFGGQVVMTSADHSSGTDRLQEAVHSLDLDAETVVVNVQGDEPLIPPAAINQVAAAIGQGVSMATLCERITETRDVFNPNIVKVVRDRFDRALYFSRAAVPWQRDRFEDDVDMNTAIEPDSPGWFRHLGIYAYTVDLLDRFVQWPVSELEQTEKLEQLRVLDNGEAIKVLESIETIPPGIDTPEDVKRTLAAIKAGH